MFGPTANYFISLKQTSPSIGISNLKRIETRKMVDNRQSLTTLNSNSEQIRDLSTLIVLLKKIESPSLLAH